MGTWGFGPFDNDGAADFLDFLHEAGRDGWSLVRQELGSRDPEMVIAAAEVVATALGVATRRDDRTLDFAIGRNKAGGWVKHYGASLPKSLPLYALKSARRASHLTHVIGWTKPESARRWDKTVASVIRRLELGLHKRTH